MGGSGVLVENDDNRGALFDYGVYLFQNGRRRPSFPEHVSPKSLDAVLLSHAHIDHSGGLPIFYSTGAPPLFATSATLALTELLIQDMLRISGKYIPFEAQELGRMMHYATPLDYDKWMQANSFRFKLFNAGHIPGSSLILLECNGKRILYTGDFNDLDTALLTGASLFEEELDAVIIESTYSQKLRSDRQKIELELIKATENILEENGTICIPAFSVGRSQEIMCILTKHAVDAFCIVDGMARAVNQIITANPESIRDYNLFLDALKKIHSVRNKKDRDRALSKDLPSVIIAPAGMLTGGSVKYYIKKLYDDPSNGLFFVSFQVEGTPGYKILKTGQFQYKKKFVDIEAQIKHFELSSHADRTGLLELLENIQGAPKVFCMHGDNDSCTLFAQEIEESLGFDAIAPNIDERFKI
ncbi:MBL fold metallo-hydrolase [Candidatus Borrarchaeum sp.]|uniref:MBL fold metallo-hydrolase n=1 Tax=Candidatus Borrarchaeum sp. TaxID=2846742 RepID=UPI0025794BCD|nr:MBL fold metallo-hydrolase [Candidatus Borrarchaeum sp.]